MFISFCFKEEAGDADRIYWPSQCYDEEPTISFIEIGVLR